MPQFVSFCGEENLGVCSAIALNKCELVTLLAAQSAGTCFIITGTIRFTELFTPLSGYQTEKPL